MRIEMRQVGVRNEAFFFQLNLSHSGIDISLRRDL
jgi:hypothetical protein